VCDVAEVALQVALQVTEVSGAGARGVCGSTAQDHGDPANELTSSVGCSEEWRGARWLGQIPTVQMLDIIHANGATIFAHGSCCE